MNVFYILLVMNMQRQVLKRLLDGRKEGKDVHNNPNQSLFGIVHGW